MSGSITFLCIGIPGQHGNRFDGTGRIYACEETFKKDPSLAEIPIKERICKCKKGNLMTLAEYNSLVRDRGRIDDGCEDKVVSRIDHRNMR